MTLSYESNDNNNSSLHTNKYKDIRVTYLDERCLLSSQAVISTLSLGTQKTHSHPQPCLYTANKLYSRYTKLYW